MDFFKSLFSYKSQKAATKIEKILPRYILPEGLLQIIEESSPDSLIIDLRTKNSRSKIENSISFPISDEYGDEIKSPYFLPSRKLKLDKDLYLLKFIELVGAFDNKKIYLYCKTDYISHAFANTILKNHPAVFILKGGFKAYREYLNTFIAQKYRFKIVTGKLLAGKTTILSQLSHLDKQIIDLDKCAQYDWDDKNELRSKAQILQRFATELRKRNPKITIWVKVSHPKFINKWITNSYSLSSQMLIQLISSPIYEVTTSQEERILKLENLLKNDYNLFVKIFHDLSNFKNITKENLKEIKKGDYFLLSQLYLKILDHKYENYSNNKKIKIIEIKSINDLV